MRTLLQTSKPVLALVTVQALLGIELVRGHAERIVAMDTDAVQHGRCGRSVGSHVVLGLRDSGSIHGGGILPRWERRPLERSRLHPGRHPEHPNRSTDAGGETD